VGEEFLGNSKWQITTKITFGDLAVVVFVDRHGFLPIDPVLGRCLNGGQHVMARHREEKVCDIW